MGTFSKIKKYSKPSHKLDEKIKNLDNQIKKTLGEATVNTTSDVYNIFQYNEPVEAVPPTNEDVPDTSGITGDDFVQPTGGGDEDDPDTWDSGWQDTSYLYNSDELAGETDRPIIQSVPNSPFLKKPRLKTKSELIDEKIIQLDNDIRKYSRGIDRPRRP